MYYCFDPAWPRLWIIKKNVLQEVISSPPWLRGRRSLYWQDMTDTGPAMLSNISDSDQTGLDMGYMLGNMDNFFLIVSGSIIILMQVLHQVPWDSTLFQHYNISRQVLGSWRQVLSGVRMSQTSSSRTLLICALVLSYKSLRFWIFLFRRTFLSSLWICFCFW